MFRKRLKRGLQNTPRVLPSVNEEVATKVTRGRSSVSNGVALVRVRADRPCFRPIGNICRSQRGAKGTGQRHKGAAL